MSSKRQKLETEISKYRNDGSWNKVKESTKNLSRKYGEKDGAVMMLEAEVKLELYLQENPPRRQNVVKARKDLSQLKSKLQESMSSDSNESSFAVREESCMLLCRLLYAQGNTSACLNMLKQIDLHQLRKEIPAPCYRLKLFAETFAIKGLCLEQTSSLNLSTENQDDTKITEYYELSSALSLDYISEYEKNQMSAMRAGARGLTVEPPMSYGMEVAFQRGPLLHMKKKNLQTGVCKLRQVLQSLESRVSTTVQQTLARDLATVLLRGMSEATYISPSVLASSDEPDTSKVSKANVKRSLGDGSPPSSTYPMSPTFSTTTDSMFFPNDCTQEAILLLIIAEAMFNADPILDMSPEYAEARTQLIHDSNSLYNLLAVALVKYSQYDMFSKTIESSLKYAYNEFHIWYQYGLSLYSAGKSDRAVRVFMECCRIRPTYPGPYLLIAKICFESRNDIELAVEYAEKGLEAASAEPPAENEVDETDDAPSGYLSSAHMAVGMGYCYRCIEGTPKEKVADFRTKALSHFEKAHKIDTFDYKPLLFTAVETALDRRITEAMMYVKKALECQPHDLNCLHLLILLLTSQKQYKEAFAVLHTVCKFYPENISLLITKCKLELHTGDNEEALRTCNHMMQIWKNLHEAYISNTLNAESMLERLTSDGLSVTNQSVGNELDIDGGSFIANSIAPSRVEQALSDIESSLGNIHPRMAGMVAGHPSVLQAHIWLQTAEVYLSLQRYEEAAQSIQEASNLFPLSHAVLYMRGRLLQCRGELVEGATMFSNTVTINPKHYKALLGWANIMMTQGRLEFAKKLLRDAVKLNPMCHEIWLCLGDVLHQTDDNEGAVDCISVAINLESTSPVVPFTTIQRDL